MAIAIPIFTNQLEKSREATDIANIRDIYAEISVAMLTDDLSVNTATATVGNGLTATTANTLTGDGTFTVTVEDFVLQQAVDNWQTNPAICAGATIANTLTVPTNKKVDVTFTFTVAGDSTYLSGITVA